MNKFVKIIFVFLVCLVIYGCNNTNSNKETKNQIEYSDSRLELVNEFKNSNKKIILDTISTTHLIGYDYEIVQTNYYRNSLIEKSDVEMKNHLSITFSLDTIIPTILDSKNLIDSTHKNIEIIKNNFSGIRAHTIYFDVEFLLNQEKYKLIYGLNYIGKTKGKFWNHFIELIE
nr:hypothetical protein [uncultured Psychroserpens sp.]